MAVQTNVDYNRYKRVAWFCKKQFPYAWLSMSFGENLSSGGRKSARVASLEPGSADSSTHPCSRHPSARWVIFFLKNGNTVGTFVQLRECATHEEPSLKPGRSAWRDLYGMSTDQIVSGNVAWEDSVYRACYRFPEKCHEGLVPGCSEFLFRTCLLSSIKIGIYCVGTGSLV